MLSGMCRSRQILLVTAIFWLSIFADNKARQAPFLCSVPSLCVRGVAGWPEALGTSSSKRRKAQVLKR